MNGTLIWFNPAKRHGFIRTEDGEKMRVEEAGFEPGHLLGDRCAGTKLQFDVEPGDEPRAVRVMVVSEEPARRARLRRH